MNIKAIKNIYLDTLNDVFRYRSVHLIVLIAILYTVFGKGCSVSNTLNDSKVAWYAITAAFHLVNLFCMFLSVIFSMRFLESDKKNGNLRFYIAAPIERITYLIGKMGGLLSIILLIYSIFNITIFLKTGISSGIYPFNFLIASLFCFINQAFIIILCTLLSVFFPDFIAGIMGFSILIISFIFDSSNYFSSIFGLKDNSNEIGSSLMSMSKVVFPKIFSLEYYSGSLILGKFQFNSEINSSFINVFIYSVILFLVLALNFKYKDL